VGMTTGSRLSRYAFIWLFALAVLGVALASAPSSAAEPDTYAQRLTELMQQSAFKGANKINDKVWTIDFNGNQLTKFKVIVTVTDKSGGLVVAFANPLTKAQFPQTPDAMMVLLKSNDRAYYLKAGIDNDGDSFVRADMPLSTDANFFKTLVGQVAAETDTIYGQLKPMMK
jgi:Putative bacterial sensory transduction regulator